MVAGSIAGYKSSSGYKGQNGIPVEFGLGKQTAIDSVVIRWPSGIIQWIGYIKANQFLGIKEEGVRSGKRLAQPHQPAEENLDTTISELQQHGIEVTTTVKDFF